MVDWKARNSAVKKVVKRVDQTAAMKVDQMVDTKAE